MISLCASTRYEVGLNANHLLITACYSGQSRPVSKKKKFLVNHCVPNLAYCTNYQAKISICSAHNQTMGFSMHADIILAQLIPDVSNQNS
jgi:predicted DNA-binding helix-hairpin-helix protein